MEKEFRVNFFLQNRHIQTIYASLFRKSQVIPYKREKFTLKDGDFLECYWHQSTQKNLHKPLVILFHGLTGSYKSPYIQGAVLALSKNGFDSVIMHFRGCGEHNNLKARSYHSGETSDTLEFLQAVKKRYPKRVLYGVGYSLGANMLLKLLGEEKENAPFTKAIAISPPMQLNLCADRMNSGFSRYYQYRLLKELKQSLYKKYDTHDMQSLLKLKREDIKNIHTFWDFDTLYTAPIHGFRDAQDYYKKCSSKQFLKDIKIPTLIIHSQDDPFMTKDVIPTQKELSQTVELELTQKGGHVGFVGGGFFKPEYWLEKRIVEYLTREI